MKMMKLILIIVFAVIILLAINLNKSTNAEVESDNNYNIYDDSDIKYNCLFDVEKYSRISRDQLIDLMGVPSKFTPTSNTNIYFYENNNREIEFEVYADKVVRCSIAMENYKYYDPFTTFGIIADANITKVTSGDSILFYKNVNDKIARVKCLLGPNSNIDYISVTYDMRPFE